MNYRRCIAAGGASNSEGVVVTFFFMRYQSVVASRSEISFARQFWSRSFFISPMEQQLADSFPEGVRGKIALNVAAMADGNPAGLFRNDDGDRVRFFRDPEARTMSKPEAAIKRFALANRKNAGCGHDPAVANDDAAVVQRALRLE